MTVIPNPPSLGDTFLNEVTGVSYEYDGEKWVITSTPGSENADQLDADLSALTSRVADGEGVQEQIQGTVSEALDTQSDIQTEQGVQNNQINALETQVQLLAQTQAAGKWDYKRNISGSSPRPPSGATFYATHKDGADTVLLNWADARLLMISKTDKDGNVFTFTDFQEGDKVEILAVDGSSLCIGTVVNQPTQEAYGNLVIGVERSNGGPSENKEYILSVYRPGANGGDVDLDVLDGRYLVKTGDTMTGDLKFDGSDRTITALGGNRLRIGARDSSNNGRTFFDIQTADSSGTEGTDSGYRCRIYHLATPTASLHAANKKYVDEQIAAIPAPTGGVPVGSIMIWMNSTVPDGWFKLQGGTFDTNTYPQLHAYLQSTAGYSSGRLPNWSGHYPGEYGDHMATSLGTKVAARTGRPEGGAPRSSSSIPNGATRTFTATGNTNAYSNGASKVTIDENWDNTTRPKTVVVHYIIKHD